jgi:hypothetical protein
MIAFGAVHRRSVSRLTCPFEQPRTLAHQRERRQLQPQLQPRPGSPPWRVASAGEASSPASPSGLQAFRNLILTTSGHAGAGLDVGIGVEPSLSLLAWAVAATVFVNILHPITRSVAGACSRGVMHRIDRRMGNPRSTVQAGGRAEGGGVLTRVMGCQPVAHRVPGGRAGARAERLRHVGRDVTLSLGMSPGAANLGSQRRVVLCQGGTGVSIKMPARCKWELFAPWPYRSR